MFFVGEAETTLYLQERHRKGLDAESEEEPDAKVGHTRIPCWTQGINSKILCKGHVEADEVLASGRRGYC
ncbi:Hypothetical predicted protein [Cloeon dipterum]|uniref:Uncharacterized protein n=1 Tax=Cloeon dipterum TaxID=197152 RepID=A0A8S1DEH8_9INSE|nr:Hypothetical predicted protein [Cloeon dipterum]